MLVVMVAESLVVVLVFAWMEMIKPWFVVIILAALIVETLPLLPALRLVARKKGAEFPAVIAQVGMSQMVDEMVEVALEYVKTWLPTAVVVDALFSMSAKTVKSVSLIADVGTKMFVLSLLNAAEMPVTNVLVMMVWQLVGILMFVVLFVVSVLIIPLTAGVAPALSLWNAVGIIVTNIPQMFVEIPFVMLVLVAD